MNAQQLKRRRDAVAAHVYGLVKIRAKRKGCGVKRLEDQGARDAVMNAAAFRLLTQIDYFFPRALRERLKPRRFGNIEVRNIDPMLWLAWVLVHRYYICLGNFWFEETEARNELIDKALDAERNAYIRASEASGGTPAGELIDPSAWGCLARYVDGGLPVEPGVRLLPANSVTDDIERQEHLEAEAAAEDAREQEAAKEFEIMREAIKEYSETLPLRHRQALWCIYHEPKLSNSDIAARVTLNSVRGIKPNTVRKIRDRFFELSDRWYLLMCPEEDVVKTLIRKVETLTNEVATLQAQQRRRESWLRVMTVEEYEAYRTSAFFASAAEWFGTTPDAILGARNTDDTLAGSIIGPKRST